jgi:hypothetical protein
VNKAYIVMSNPKGNLETLNQYKSKWNTGKTRTIRVPIAITDRVLEVAHKIDNGELDNTVTSELELKAKLREILEKHKNNVKSYQTKNASGIINDLKALLE